MSARQAPPGWYAPDGSDPTTLRFWDGTTWTQHYSTVAALPPPVAPPVPPPLPLARPLPAARPLPVAPGVASSGIPSWLVSWPAILIGFVLCFVPGLVLLWLRPNSSTKVKALCSAAAFSAMVLGFAAPSSLAQRGSDVAAPPTVLVPPSAQPTSTPPPTPTIQTPTPTATPTPSTTPTPTASASRPTAKRRRSSRWPA